jgi:hypothetical protein
MHLGLIGTTYVTVSCRLHVCAALVTPYAVVVVRDNLALLTGFNPLLRPVTLPDHARFLHLSNPYSPASSRFGAHGLRLQSGTVTEGTCVGVSD